MLNCTDLLQKSLRNACEHCWNWRWRRIRNVVKRLCWGGWYLWLTGFTHCMQCLLHPQVTAEQIPGFFCKQKILKYVKRYHSHALNIITLKKHVWDDSKVSSWRCHKSYLRLCIHKRCLDFRSFWLHWENWR